jgi:drug/metabolite transporter (DMT)-like permease
VLLREGFPRPLLMGCGVAFAGVVVIGLGTSGPGTSTTGVALCLLAGCLYAVGVVSQKAVVRRIPALQTTFLCCVIGTAVCLPFAPALVHQVRTAGPGPVAWMLYLGTFPTAIAFTTWAYALARTNAGRLSALTYLVPPLSVLLGWLLLGEAPPLVALAGGALCLSGVILSRRPSSPKPAVSR